MTLESNDLKELKAATDQLFINAERFRSTNPSINDATFIDRQGSRDKT